MKYTIKEKNFFDNLGRERIWNGINIVFKGEQKADGTKDYIYNYTEQDFAKLQAFGINLIRLGIVWDGLEHEYNKFDNEYLENIKTTLDLCTKYEIDVFLDMHQDLYSCIYGGGAPQWATLSEGKPHITGDVWSDAYIFSEAVNTSFVNFWNNEKTSFGVGLIDHYKHIWSHVISHFKDHPALIGYDFINEPFSGENSQLVLGTLLASYCQLTGQEVAEDKLLELFTDEQKKLELLKTLDNKELYSNAASSAIDLVQVFDQTKLANFYVELTKMLRDHSHEGFVLTENSYFSNMGIEAGTKQISYEGTVEKLQVYSPHGYDLVVDSPLVSMSSNNRIDAILDAHKRVQTRLNVPVIFGEWGAHYKSSEGLNHLKHIINYFDENKWSHTYYCWFRDITTYPIMEILSRPYPQAVAGNLHNYHYDFTSKQFTMTWLANVLQAPTIVYLPTKPTSINCNQDYQLVDCSGYYHLLISSNNQEIKLLVNL